MPIKNYQLRCQCGFVGDYKRFVTREKFDKVPPYDCSKVTLICPKCYRQCDCVQRSSSTEHPLYDAIYGTYTRFEVSMEKLSRFLKS